MNDFLVQLIVVAVLANVVLLLAALIVPRLRRPARPLATSSGPAVDGIGIASIAIPSRQPLPAAPALPTTAPEAEGDSSTTMRSDTEETQRQRRFFLPREDEYPTPESVEAFLTAGQRREDAERWVDDQTGLETGFAWEMAVDREEKRVARYAKPVTVVVAELDRLDALAARLGADNADRLVTPVATTLRRLARSADLVARTAHARFQVLMPETDEVQAINYVERIRDACDMWLEASAVSVRLVVGWASAGAGVSIHAATRLAEQRMHADRARPTYGRPRGGLAAQDPSGLDSGPHAAPSAPVAPGSGPSIVRPGPVPAPSADDLDRPATSPAAPDPASDPSVGAETRTPAPDPWRPGPSAGPTL